MEDWKSRRLKDWNSSFAMWKSGLYSLYLVDPNPIWLWIRFHYHHPRLELQRIPEKKKEKHPIPSKKKDHMSKVNLRSHRHDLQRYMASSSTSPPQGNATLPKNVIDPWPQVMSNLQLLPTNDTALLQDQQHLRNTLGNDIRAENHAAQAHGLMEPSTQ